MKGNHVNPDGRDVSGEQWETMPLLHIYGQGAHHDDVMIVGNYEALAGLAKAINQAIRERNGESEAFVADGEGYAVRVMVHNKPWDGWHKLPMPYSEDFAKDHRNYHELLYPEQIWHYNTEMRRKEIENAPRWLKWLRRITAWQSS